VDGFSRAGGQEFWTGELSAWHENIQYDGIWIDLSEASSFCVGSCGQYQRDANPAHPPFLLPGDPGNIEYRYPESFNATKATEAASATSASCVQASAHPTSSTTQTLQSRTTPTPGVKDLNFPPYVINNIFGGHALVKNSISPHATHNDEYNTTEYEMHNLFGHQIVNATYQALLSAFPNRRPFVVGRATFAGSCNVTAHWGGDNTSMWGSLWFSISQALQFAIAGIPMFGTDTCGFAGNTDMELCNRWMQLSAFFPFYRNHNVIASIPQEAYRWASVADATRTVMQIRYSLLPYFYTLFWHAHAGGETVMRALAWEFPNDHQLASVDTQFMLGSALIITPVLEPLVTTVNGVFPGVADGVIWYDWYTLLPLQVAAGENKTLDAPLGHINVHIKGGSILPLQEPGNTTEMSRRNPWGLLVALDQYGKAAGDLYLDDGMSLVQNATKYIKASHSSSGFDRWD
jgi:alpha-glucosidase